MKLTITLTVTVETEAAGHELEAATQEIGYEAQEALDYWFSHTDRPMTCTSVTSKAKK